ncbi:hypothetical protein CS401_06190 [Fusobacterium vincentii]|nr:hypothetical protein CS401_06190 [Fusobacterium vincentii]
MSETSLSVLQRILNFYPLRNLASNELFFILLLAVKQLQYINKNCQILYSKKLFNLNNKIFLYYF